MDFPTSHLSTWTVKTLPLAGELFVLHSYDENILKEAKMKTIAQPAVITPSILILALLAAAVVFIGATGKKVPLLSNVRLDIILLVILGMSICTQAGIGRIAATGQWSHPLAIVGYVLGGTILIIATSVFVGWKLPFIQNDQQALIAIAILAGLKIVNAVTHYLLSRF
jgi:hypothetical protein